jgi:hypothetical protein
VTSGGQRLRCFDPVTIGRYECDAWVGYYRRDWPLVLRAALGMVRSGFRMAWPATVAGAWYVLRANQKWAPYPDNDPDAARRLMTSFYALVASRHRLTLDPPTAARLEVTWWHEHRILQRETPDAAPGAVPDRVDDAALVGALAALYSYVYQVDAAQVRPAAAARAQAMHLSDRWVDAGCDLADPLLREERQLLVTSYSLLRDAVAPPES